ncbi:MAG: tRNA pseudouridine synthase [Gammaproteobacteria bacterium]|nr:tRNA pseudouridine synthase [Gammaproteobacteria bacterium]
MGRKRKTQGRHINGILLLDKPGGITSNGALQRVKNLFQARKAGHTGSLDMQASGLLPICLGEATKLSGYLLDSDKYYQAVCKLGIETSTGDAAGATISTKHVPELTKQKVEDVLAQFHGDISQVPPMHSALKHKGQRLYQLAYQGIEVERKPRVVTIYELALIDLSGDEIEIRIHCSKGTYIRTLAEDIGNKLGCGAHLKSLRRLGAGPFRAEQMISLDELERLAEAGSGALDQQLLAMDTVLVHLPEVELSESVAYYLRQGQAVVVPHAPTEGLVRMYDQHRTFIGVGTVLDDGRIAPQRLIRTQT